MASVRGGDKWQTVLNKLAAGLSNASLLQVGFLENATYSDGTSVPLIAAMNEFGRPPRQPPRPFMRLTVNTYKATWGPQMAASLKATNYNAKLSLDRLGQIVKGDIQQSIRDLMAPPLSPITIARKGFDKPLIDTGHMISSVDYRVK